MKIIFYENRYGNWVDKLIRFKTATWTERLNGKWKDLPSHVELLFNDGMMFSASARENKVRFKKHNYRSKAWNRIDLPVSAKSEAKIRTWCESKVGLKYDYLGILEFVLPFIEDAPHRWFCSEVCDEALKVNTIILFKYFDIDSSKVSPARLKSMVLKTLGVHK